MNIPVAVMAETAKARFRQFNLTLPSIVTTGRPQDLSQLFANQSFANVGLPLTTSPLKTAVTSGIQPVGSSLFTAKSLAPRVTATPMSIPPAMLGSASNDKVDVDFQKEISDDISGYIDGICRAIGTAHGIWMSAAMLHDVAINGPVATGGRLDGPSLAPLIKANAPMTGMIGMANRYSSVIADAIGSVWQTWQSSMRVPGAPWYPSFVAVPSPTAPPTPNVPSPLMQVSNVSILTNTSLLESSMRAGTAPGPFSNELFSSIAAAFTSQMSLWVTATIVKNVLGQGPVPTFAPPYVPVGPVVAGIGNSTPGFLS